jgi:thioesterase domain-containing protein
VEAALLSHPGVREAAVLARAGEDGSRRLVAYVAGAALPGVSQWWGWLRERLPEYMIPAAFVDMERLPLTANGKLDRRALPEPGRASANRGNTHVPPRDAVEVRLQHIWEELLDQSPIGVQDDFFESGGDSLKAVRVVSRVNREFESAVTVAMLTTTTTIEELAVTIRRGVGRTSSDILVPLQPRGSNARIFCVHPSGGNVVCYLELARSFGTSRPIWGIQCPGLRDESAIPANVEAAAARYIEAIQTVQPTGPYYLIGYSTGGVIAYEIARQLEMAGDPVALLALLDTTAPRGTANTIDDAAEELLATIAAELEVPQDTLADTPLEARIERLLEEAQRLHRLPPDLEVGDARLLVRVFAKNVLAASNYAPAPYHGKVTLLRADSGGPEPGDQTLGWAAFAQHVEVHTVSGSHNAMSAQPLVGVVARILKACLQRTAAIEGPADTRVAAV